MRVLFAGTPEFARAALASLLEHGFDVVGVLTQPDRPSGRGMKLTPSPVKQLALQQHIPVLQPQTLRHPVVQEQLKTYRADVMVVAAYGLILPQEVLEIPRLGCLNIHASLLPRWRGAAPIQRAIEAGDTETGITIMQMDEGLDTGDILWKESLPIEASDTAGSLHDKLASLGGQTIVYALQRLGRNQLTATPQPQNGVTYAAKIQKEDGMINWSLPAKQLERRIRAMNPGCGISCAWNNSRLKIWQAQVVDRTGTAGHTLEVSETSWIVGCGEKALSLEVVQQPDHKRLPIADFLRGHEIACGPLSTHTAVNLS
jgi:methionyl-tRNA formyltransferase